jgi:hypothetical protein
MRFVLPACLLLVALIHLAPMAGVMGGSHLASLYGVRVSDPNLEILLRHRAVLFGILAGLLLAATVVESLRTAAIVAGGVSVLSFLAIAFLVGDPNAALRRIVQADLLALVPLAVAAVLHWRSVRGR